MYDDKLFLLRVALVIHSLHQFYSHKMSTIFKVLEEYEKKKKGDKQRMWAPCPSLSLIS